jgi:hypothetical protein
MVGKRDPILKIDRQLDYISILANRARMSALIQILLLLCRTNNPGLVLI